MPRILALSEKDIQRILDSAPVPNRKSAADLAKDFGVADDVINALWYAYNKLSEKQIIEALENNQALKADGKKRETGPALAKDLGITQQTISRMWTAFNKDDKKKKKPSDFLKGKLNKKDIEKLVEMHNQNIPIEQCAKNLGASIKAVENQLNAIETNS